MLDSFFFYLTSSPRSLSDYFYHPFDFSCPVNFFLFENFFPPLTKKKKNKLGARRKIIIPIKSIWAKKYIIKKNSYFLINKSEKSILAKQTIRKFFLSLKNFNVKIFVNSRTVYIEPPHKSGKRLVRCFPRDWRFPRKWLSSTCHFFPPSAFSCALLLYFSSGSLYTHFPVRIPQGYGEHVHTSLWFSCIGSPLPFRIYIRFLNHVWYSCGYRLPLGIHLPFELQLWFW